MKRLPALVLVSLAVVSQAAAASLQDLIDSNWKGAWVITLREVSSACDGFYTNNRVTTDLVSGRGGYRFEAGELARVDGVDLKRSRLDLHLNVVEPVLASYLDGPFTLYRQRSCRVEMMVELDRQWVAGGRLERIDEAVRAVLERHTSEAKALASVHWNRRQQQPYPDDYDLTLAEHAAWKAQMFNASVDAAYANALIEASRVMDRLREDPDYLEGFARGVETARDHSWGQCGSLVGGRFALIHTKASRECKGKTEQERQWLQGYEDGQRLARSLALLRTLPDCRVEVPPVPGMEPAGE